MSNNVKSSQSGRNQGVRKISGISHSALSDSIRSTKLSHERKVSDLVAKIPPGHPVLGRIKFFESKGIRLTDIPESHPIMIDILGATASIHEERKPDIRPDQKAKPQSDAKKVSAAKKGELAGNGLKRSKRLVAVVADFKREREELMARRLTAKRSIESAMADVVRALDVSFASIAEGKNVFADSSTSEMVLRRMEAIAVASRRSFIEQVSSLRRLEVER